MTDKTLGAYKRTTPDPDETTGEVLARLQAEMARLLDEADGGVTAALIEQEVEQPAAEVRELRSALARELARGNALQDALDAAESRPLTPDAITDEMVKRGFKQLAQMDNDGISLRSTWAARQVLEAALTEPPARPEGAEEWREELDEMPAVQDLTPGQRDRLADALAERDHALGGRVVGEEDPR